MMRAIIAAFCLSSLIACAADKTAQARGDSSSVQSGTPQGDEAVRLVHEYVERDSRGERLEGPAPWFHSVVTWPDDPGYDSYTVITGFEINPGAASSDTAHVRVQYHTVGWIAAGDSLHSRFTPRDTLEVQDFVLLRRGQRWAISAPQIDQHVLLDSALAKSLLAAVDRRKLQGLRQKP
jgi:hypothetical protein